ncbi:MAG: sigma-70 family RNA polymerase sigma factor [Planctomycetes bacterium]|nr:sigma-70 family RNA polymerase sigma factor [Planctomycetota bacterium]
MVMNGAESRIRKAVDDHAIDVRDLLRELRDLPSDRAGPLLEQFRPYLLAIAVGEFPERLQAKVGNSDLVQETLLRGFESLAEFRGESIEELARWLRRILVNHMTNVATAFATEKRNVAHEVPLDSHVVDPLCESPSAEVLSGEEWDRLRSAIGTLSEIHQQIVLLRHRENLSFAAIGKLLDRSEDAARKLWCRAIERLQSELDVVEPRKRPK